MRVPAIRLVTWERITIDETIEKWTISNYIFRFLSMKGNALEKAVVSTCSLWTQPSSDDVS
jgi:hypothetical protein